MTRQVQEPVYRTLPIGAVVPNSFNPNRMEDEKFEACKHEVKRLGHPAKPTVVRPLENDRYEIIDGEHGWRAASELGMESMICEIRDIDDFDAKLECRNRNQHGESDPLLEGRMFRSMMADRKLSQRALAKVLQVSEGTVRMRLEYVEAAELRRAYAPETADEDIAGLTQREVSYYRSMPATVRDRWLDAGADICAFEGVTNWPDCRVAAEIHGYKLAEYLDTGSPYAFAKSVKRLAAYCIWSEEHAIEDIRLYLVGVASLRLPASVLDLLPLEQRDATCDVLMTPTQWKKVLHDAKKRGSGNAGLLALVQSGVNVALRAAGHDLAEVCGPEVAESLQIISGAPEYIRDAEYLTLAERQFLAERYAEEEGEIVQAALAATCDVLRRKREQGVSGECHGLKDTSRSGAVVQVFNACFSKLQQQGEAGQYDGLFADVESLFFEVLQRLKDTSALRAQVIDGRPAGDVLEERLNTIDWPEFFLLATGVLEVPIEDTATRWLKAVTETNIQQNDDVSNHTM